MSAALPTWRESLEEMLHRHAHLPFTAFTQVATVRADGRPANRTLTFRFFLSNDRLLFTADCRTEKITQLDINPWAEACWYFTESRVQFRLLGKMQTVIDTQDEELISARKRTWQERSMESRQSFTWPVAGEALADPAAFELPAPSSPPAGFALLALSPVRVEILDLANQPHARSVHWLEDGTWGFKKINP